MQRLTGLDASFLYLETSSQLLHVCALITLDASTIPGGYSFDRMKKQLEERVAVIPAFRRKLHSSRFNMDHPVWVEDDEFDIDHHVHRIGVPGPGGKVEIAELCAHVAGQPMSRRRPLWEMHIVEGAADGSIVIIAKMHHAGIDGVSGANLMTYLAGLEPDAPLPEIPREQRVNPTEPNTLELIGDGLVRFVRKPVELCAWCRAWSAWCPSSSPNRSRVRACRCPSPRRGRRSTAPSPDVAASPSPNSTSKT